MCLAIPAQVCELLADDQARVRVGDVVKTVNMALVPDVRPGEFVIIHVGYALARLDPIAAEQTLVLLRAAGEIQQRDSRSAPEPTGQERNDEIH
ncbi:HypC/HybG/HupF family hydrogenase formation chaperone [Reinekea sp.]|uniref:HypC/HybG/HupF family hydrogenase formation chaperone n=1 Tax=Reinekea sp. TaxID=1970455 RepID=UPI002A832BA1|nr:HypC/HybG/HupF family hydrogenase formation chaperone [Reinekea sp.]